MALPFAQQAFPELYEQFLVEPLFTPWVDPLLDDVRVAPGDRLLDVACGTGIVARRAKARLGPDAVVVGVDLNPGMLAVARRVAPGIEWREGNATALPLQGEERFDVVTCQQGFQFVPDGAAAAQQFRRALAAGGRLGVSTWRPDEEFAVLRSLRGVAEARLGPIVDRRHSLGDPARLEALLRDAGLNEVRSHTQTRVLRFPDGEAFVRMNAMALVGMSGPGKDLADAERERLVDTIARDSAAILAENTDAGGFAYELGTNVTTARA